VTGVLQAESRPAVVLEVSVAGQREYLRLKMTHETKQTDEALQTSRPKCPLGHQSNFAFRSYSPAPTTSPGPDLGEVYHHLGVGGGWCYPSVLPVKLC